MSERGAASPRAAVILIALVWALCVVLWFQVGLAKPDGAGYYVYLPSTWLDHDLVFFDEWQAMGMVRDGVIHHKEVTETGHLGNHWTSGASLAWYPAYVAADLLRPILPGNFPRNGFSLPYNAAVVFTSALAGLGALLLAFFAGRRVAGPKAALIAAIGGWLGTPLFFYSIVHGTMSHAISAFACAAAVAAALALRERDDVSLVLLAGLAAGFACAVRPQNAPIALAALLIAEPLRRRWTIFLAGGAAAAAPQLAVSSFLYGTPWGFLTGGTAKPFASFERIWLWEPLFSWYHGLFTWTPFALLGVIGLVVLWRRDRPLALAGLLMIASQWAINASLERTFWGGVAFGQRRFDNSLIFFIIGAAVLAAAVRPALAVLATAATSLWTLSLFAAVRSGLDLAVYHTPRELFAAQLAAVSSWPALLVPFGAVPAARRGVVAVTLLALAVVAAVVIAAGWFVFRSARAAAVAAMAYAFAMLFFFIWCGAHDAARIEEARPLIERNLVVGDLPGGPDVRFGLLQDEIEFLRKSGRPEDAARTQRELDELRAARDAAIRRLQEGR